MEMRPLGKTDLKVSALCLGTMMYGDQVNETEAHAQMDVAFARGINFFDTAEMYTVPPKPETQGNSERIVGSWIKKNGARDKIILATKVAGRSPMSWVRNGEATRLTKAQILKAADDSLARLQTDYIDLYQLHWPDRTVKMFGGELYGYSHYDDDYISYEETLSALEELVQVGKVRHVGLSNETPYGAMQYLNLASTKDMPRMVSIQNAYNLVNRTFESGLAEIAMEEQMGLLAYSPIGQGVLSGKYLDGANPVGSRNQLFGRMSRYETPGAIAAIRAYVALAAKFELDPSALAMQFVTTRPWVTSNIFGATNMAQLEVIFSSLDIDWTNELNRAVNKIHAASANPCP